MGNVFGVEDINSKIKHAVCVVTRNQKMNKIKELINQLTEFFMNIYMRLLSFGNTKLRYSLVFPLIITIVGICHIPLFIFSDLDSRTKYASSNLYIIFISNFCIGAALAALLVPYGIPSGLTLVVSYFLSLMLHSLFFPKEEITKEEIS